MTVMTLDDLRTLAARDEMDGDLEARIATVAARAELAQRGEEFQMSPRGSDDLSYRRVLAAAWAEAADPMGAIRNRVTVPQQPEPQPKPDPLPVVTRPASGSRP